MATTATAPPTGVANAELVRWAVDQLNRHDVPPLKQIWTSTTVALAEQGDEVFARWHLTGTHTGRFFGLDPTGKPLALDGMDHFTIRDDHVAANFVVYDQLQFARAIGLMPPDGSAPDRAMKAAFNAKTRVAKEIQARRSTS